MGIAVHQHGKPYVHGAAGPRAFDCSGPTSYAFHHAGFARMPRTASAQAHFAWHIPRSRMHHGDLIFFTGGGAIYHVGLYAGFQHGHRLVLHAPYPGQRVRTHPVDQRLVPRHPPLPLRTAASTSPRASRTSSPWRRTRRSGRGVRGRFRRWHPSKRATAGGRHDLE